MIRLGVGGARKKEAGEDLYSSITESCFLTSPVCYGMREWI